MEGKKHLIRLTFTAGLMLFLMQYSIAQPDHRKEIYEAYARGKMDVWYVQMTAFESTRSFTQIEEQLDLTNLYYGYTAWLISVKKDKLATEYIEKSMPILDEILAQEPENATAMAYKGAFIAFEIGIANWKAIYLGGTSMDYIKGALELDSNNIQANVEMGNSNFYSPPMFGGDKALSIAYYKKAGEQMELKGLVSDNWLYLNVMTALGMAYEATGQIQEAKSCYEKILKVKSNFMWVGEELYPDMIKRYKL